MQETINIRRGNGITPITYIDSGQIAEIKKHGKRFHEFTMLEAIAKIDLPRGTFVDVGAHVGNHSIFFAKYCKSCEHVLAYDPSNAYRTLFDNVSRQSLLAKITTIRVAVGAKRGKCNVVNNSERPGQSTVDTKPGGQNIMIAIDDIEWDYPPVLIKVDVEGTEYDILEGARQTIMTYRPELFVETFREPEKLLKHLPEGYRIVKRYNNAPTYHLTAK